MKDYHDEQFDPRTACSGSDCAASTTAMDIYFGTRGRIAMTHLEVRNASGVSCVPGRDTPSGGLDVAAVERVCEKSGVEIDFRGTSGSLRRWNETEVYARLSTFFFGHLLGMYSNVPYPWRARGSTFKGGHSIGVHDVRDDLPDSHYGKVQRTACWHDPLRKRPIRVPYSVVKSFVHSDSHLEGLAGWVKIPPAAGARYASPMTDRTRTAYSTVAVHNARTKGKASTTRLIEPRGDGVLVEVAMYAPGEPYGSGPDRNTWGALSLLGDEWVHLNRLRQTHGGT